MSSRNLTLLLLCLTGCSEQLGDVRINEVSASNQSNCLDAFGDPGDWIELFNATSSMIDLGGYAVYNDDTAPELGVLAAGVTIAPRGYLVLWADAKSRGLDHLAFKLSSGGDRVTLADPDGAVLDTVSWAASDPDISYARVPDGTGDFESCAMPTCGADNGR